MVSKLDHWVTSPYCFCKDLPWLVLSGLPAAPTGFLGGMGWEELSILAASLIALATFLFLLFLLLCLLCPGGLCCGPGAACCGKTKDEKKKIAGTSAAGAVEMSSFGGSDGANLTAVDLKLPRAWMDSNSKGEMFEDGDLGLGLGQFGTHKNWSSSNGDASSGLVNRSAKLGNQNARSGYSSGVRLGVDEDWLDGMDGDSGRIVSRSAKLGNHNARSGYSSGVRLGVDEDWLDGADGDSGRIDYYRTRSATSASAATNGGGNVRDTVREWESRERRETRRTVESRQTREADDTRDSGYDRRMAGDDVESSRSCVHDSAQRETSALTSSSNSKQQLTSSNMALVKSSGSAFASEAKPAEDVYQCYTVTKKTTTTTYGDEDGDEETAVVTTTEKKWREGMNEVGEISVSASASAGELLPSIGAPAHVLADVNNVRTVKSLTSVDGCASDVIRRYEFQQTSKTGDTVL